MAWLVGFVFYSVAALMEAGSEAVGAWDPNLYRIYIVLAASMVGFLGLGSLYLISKRPLWPRLYLGFDLVCLAIFFFGVFTTPLLSDILVAGITVGGKPLGDPATFPRVMSLFFNIPGTLLLLGSAALSIVRLWPKRYFRYRVWANALIIVGTLVIATAGSLARAGSTVGLYPAEMVGAAFLLWGFIKASTLEKGAELAKADRAPRG